MTPRLIAAALGADPIAGMTHEVGYTACGWSDAVEVEPCLSLTVECADVTIYLNQDDLSGVFAFATMLPEEGAVSFDDWGVFVFDAP